MRIKFTADPKLPRDIAHLDYRKGVEVELSDDQAERWLRRGVAEIVVEKPTAAQVAAEEAAPAAPAEPAAAPAEAELTEPAKGRRR